MKFKNNTKESYADLNESYEHTVVLKQKDVTSAKLQRFSIVVR